MLIYKLDSLGNIFFTSNMSYHLFGTWIIPFSYYCNISVYYPLCSICQQQIYIKLLIWFPLLVMCFLISRKLETLIYLKHLKFNLFVLMNVGVIIYSYWNKKGLFSICTKKKIKDYFLFIFSNQMLQIIHHKVCSHVTNYICTFLYYFWDRNSHAILNFSFCYHYLQTILYEKNNGKAWSSNIIFHHLDMILV